MLQSMTGYGKATSETEKASISVEIKSVNSKTTDISMRLPRIFMDKEIEVRKILTSNLLRGKINLYADYQAKGDNIARKTINKELLKAYYDDLKAAADFVGHKETSFFNLALAMPDIMKSDSDNEALEQDWTDFTTVLNEAIIKFVEFRKQEGSNLETALKGYVDAIESRLQKVKALDTSRIEAVKDRIKSRLEELKIDIDQNRFEQELIYYSEKLDITEEKVRLKSHLDYIKETMIKEGSGKKLNFIAQEIGREINTIGSKANNSTMQKLVVEMKDELEKIKEQVLNVL